MTQSTDCCKSTIDHSYVCQSTEEGRRRRELKESTKEIKVLKRQFLLAVSITAMENPQQVSTLL